MASLEVSGDEAWLDAFGVAPEVEASSGDEFVQEVTLPVSDIEDIVVSWDVTDASVRVRHRRRDTIVTDLFRETATLLAVMNEGALKEVVVEYGVAGLSGRTRVQVLPQVKIEDQVLQS